MILAFAAGHALARAGVLVDALLAAAVLCTVGWVRRAAIGATLVATPILVGAELWRSSQIEHLRHHPALAAAAIVAAAVVVVALAVVVRRRPQALALLVIVALPFRFSFLAGGTGGILIALYAVIWAGGLAYLLPGREARAQTPAGALERALAAFVVLYAVAALYTPTRLAKAVENVGFFSARSPCCSCCCAACGGIARCCCAALGIAVALAGLFVAVAAASTRAGT